MKLTWKNKNNKRPITTISPLLFDHQQQQEEEISNERPSESDTTTTSDQTSTADADDTIKLSQSFQAQGNNLADVGKYREALGKWEAAITLTPERATLHEQKAQVLLEIGETWKSLMAATRATELEPSWAEAWVTLGRAQLNYGEPDCAVKSFDTALTIKPDFVEAKEDKKTAQHLVKKRKQLHSSGLSVSENRYVVAEKTQEDNI
ncbi:uncharacterized protein [Rutidosis leptorrhynchoides]|uniref:uncharacterized protein n=1 Tax=Rutidosis leptorrhynchoides TaxID=125765 RepID=UPI003A9A25D2